MPEEHVTVLIVGGGGAGLTASMLLARHGVDHLLVSARPGTSDLPKAHVLNQRAMEILEDCGVADEIAERSTPAEQMAATAYYAGFAGDEPDSGRRIARLESWGAGGDNELLAGGEPVAPAEPAADPARADPQGRRRAALAGPDPLQPRAARARTGRRRRDSDRARQRQRRDLHGALRRT